MTATNLKDATAPVVFFANGIGDVLLAMPALRALCALFPGRLTLLTRSSPYVGILSRLPVRHLHVVRSGARAIWETRESDGLAACIGQCDLFISLVAWHSASLAYLSHALHADVTIGYDQSFDIALPRLYTKHTADLMFDAVRVIDSQLQLHDFLVVPTYASRARTAAETIKQTLHGMKLLAVHTETTAAKTWKPESWTKVLDEFLGARDEYIAILVDYERRLPQLSGASADGRVIDASGLPLEGALCLVQHSNLFVGVDSCMLHAADFGGVPSVGLFISTSAKEFGFLMAPHVAIEAQSADAIDCRRVTSAMAALAVNPSQRSTIFA